MATIRDIAAATGRSTATVDRVLHHRPGVREGTRRAILDAAVRLNYAHALPAGLGFDLVLPDAGGFMQVLIDHAQREGAGASLERLVRVHPTDYARPGEIARMLRRLRERSAGVALVAVDHREIRDELRDLIARNVPVVTMVTDISSLPHQGYVGIDNRQAGRMAGYLIGRFVAPVAGRVAVFTGSRAFRGHEEREMGFRGVMRERFGHLVVAEVLEIGEDAEAGFAAMRTLLEGQKLAAIYNIGAGSAGIARALADLPGETKPVFVAHDLSVDTRAYLAAGTIDAVIDQNAALLVRRTIDRLVAAAGSSMLGVSETVEPRIILPENIPGDD